MNRNQRIAIIPLIANSLTGIDSEYASVILREHGWHRYGFLSGDVATNRRDIIDFLTDCSDDVLSSLYNFLTSNFNDAVAEPVRDSNLTQVKIFITHLDSQRQLASLVKDSLENEGVLGFVAHEDIQDSSEWRRSIKEELDATHGLLVIITEGIEDSVWCLQEIGWALSRKIPIAVINFGQRAPNLGFLSDIQFIRGNETMEKLASRVVSILKTNPVVVPMLRQFVIDSFINSGSFSRTRSIWLKLKQLGGFSQEEKDLIIDAFDHNTQLSSAGIDNRPALDVVREFFEL